MSASTSFRLFNKAISFAIMAAALVISVSQEASAQAGNVYGGSQAQVVSSVEEGVILQVSTKQVEASWQARATGGTAGGVVGAVFANLAGRGGDYNAQSLLNTLGAIGGGLAGERIANAVATKDAQEIVVGIRDARTQAITKMITVVQPAPFDALAENDVVLVANTGGAFRIIKRNF